MTLTPSSPTEFITTDTATAAYLQSEGFELTLLDASNPRHCVFHFENSNSKLEEFVHNFEAGKAEGNVSQFFFCYKRLLFRIKAGL